MPASTVDGPSVSLSFANNFWGKEDAGVAPLLERMHNAKVTGDELKAFYTSRAQIEEEYARKLLNLARKPLGSSESGTLRMSLDVVRGEIESMGKAHQQIAGQMKGELEEPLAAFAGGMKERRKIIQTGIEKLLKTKTQQTTTVNKARDRYEQDCLKIKGYLAQGHMVMGQEERKNKAKLEKTQIQMSATSNEYEAAVKVLEETTIRWNKEWKAACDKFQDLEEERIDFTKSSLWGFANVSSTVCVSDDASCEKVRLSLEDCDVEKDITTFIKETGTGQEIPDAPKFINFCRGDISDNISEASDDGAYSVAQFQRTINPTYRTSSPGPKNSTADDSTPRPAARQGSEPLRASQTSNTSSVYDDLPNVPHNNYPMDGMTQFCRIGPPSDRSSIPSPTRPESRDDRSEYSNPTSHSSYGHSIGSQSPTKQFSVQDDKQVQKRKSGFFQNHSPFRRKSKLDKDMGSAVSASRNGWSTQSNASSPSKSVSGRQSRNAHFGNTASPDPEPVDPRANFQLNVGNNVFDVASPDARNRPSAQRQGHGDNDPIAQALAELKGVTKESSQRVSADRYHGLATPAPAGTPGTGNTTPRPFAGQELRSSQGRTPPPLYDSRPQSRLAAEPQSRLGAPQPAFTSKQMQQTTASYVNRGRDVFNTPPQQGQHNHPPRSQSAMGRPSTREGRPEEMPKRSTSPRPYMNGDRHGPQSGPRAASTDPYSAGQNASYQGRPRGNTMSPQKTGYGPPQGQQMRSQSPQPGYRPGSNQGPNGRGSMQPSQDGSGNFRTPRPTSQLYGDGPYSMASGGGPSPQQQQAMGRPRPQSSGQPVGGPQVTRDGRPILHFSKAVYMYQAAIPEELSFAKGDMLAVVRHQDDGWWEAEVCSRPGRAGLVPSNYLQPA